MFYAQMMKKQYYSHILTLCLSIVLGGCAAKNEDYTQLSAEETFKRAEQSYHQKDYKDAALLYSEVEKNHPYSNLAVKSQIYSAYSYYVLQDYDQATEAFGLFIQLHPNHEKVPYALYMRAMCAYHQIPIIERDLEPAHEALTYFKELVNRFPNTPYAKDSQQKIDQVETMLAGKEMDVGRFYMNSKGYISAIHRFQIVIHTYPKTPYVAEAYYRIIEAYKAMGLKNEATSYLNALKTQDASKSWYLKAKAL